MIVPIVEGKGDAAAVPLLLRKLLQGHGIYDVQVGQPKVAHGVGNLRAEGEERQYLERFLEYAAMEPGASGLLVLVDADEDRGCPPRLSLAFAERARARRIGLPVAIIVATPGYEAWLIASVASMAGRGLAKGHIVRPGLQEDCVCDGDPEAIGDPKGWLSRHMPPNVSYKETVDQEALTVLLDVDLAREHSASFRYFEKSVLGLVERVRVGDETVTPATPPGV